MTPFTTAHSSGMYELWSSPEVCSYSGPAEDFEGKPIVLPARTAEDSDKILDFFIQYQNLAVEVRRAKVRWAMLFRSNNKFVGALGFNSLGACSEIAYHQIPFYWGRGLMIEAGRAVISWVTSSYGSSSVEAFVEPDNIASIKLTQKLGLKRTGESREGAERFLLDTIS